MRQSIRGYTDAVIDQAGEDGTLSQIAGELAAIEQLVVGSADLTRVLTDPGVPVTARRGVVTDLFESRVHADSVRLVTYAIEVDRVSDFAEDLTWLVARIDAAAQGRVPIGEPILGTRSAEERLDGYTTRVLQGVGDTAEIGEIEDEIFRFTQTVKGSDELSAALSSRDVPAKDRRALIEDLLRSRATAATTALAAYGTQIGRPRDYQDLLHYLIARLAAEGNRRVAEVRAAVSLDDDERNRLIAALSRVAGRQVELRVRVDPAVLGGFVATIGDTVVDGSTRHRLDLLKERFEMPEAEITTGDVR